MLFHNGHRVFFRLCQNVGFRFIIGKIHRFAPCDLHIFGRGAAGDLFKDAVEIPYILKTAGKSDLCHRRIGADKEFRGQSDADRI